MNARTSFALTVLLTSLTFACSGTVEPKDPNNTGDGDASGDGDGDGGPTLGSPSNSGSEDWTRIQPCTGNGPEDDIMIDSVAIEGSTMTIEASHGGGCERHSYALCYSEAWAESDPVQIGLKLLHESNDDPCEALESIELEFDLEPLEKAYSSAYNTESGDMWLQLDGESVLHSFGSPAPTREELDAAIDELNTCEVVDDCVSIPTTACQHAYVNKDADTTELSELISRYNRSNSDGGDIACDDSCACGILSCEAGKCTTGQHDCTSDPAEGQKTICL